MSKRVYFFENFRLVPVMSQPFEHSYYPCTLQLLISLYENTLSNDIIDDTQLPEPSTVGQTIKHQIDRPVFDIRILIWLTWPAMVDYHPCLLAPTNKITTNKLRPPSTYREKGTVLSLHRLLSIA